MTPKTPSDKKPMSAPVILTKTRYIGFSRAPVRDNDTTNLIAGLPAPCSDYPLLNGERWIDATKAKP